MNRGRALTEVASATLREIQSDYLADLQVRVTPRHYLGVSRRLGRLIGRLGEKRSCDLRVMDVVRVRNEQKAAGASNRTCDTYSHALKAMLTWAVDSGLIAANPIASLKRLPGTRDHQVCRRRALTDAEIERFLAASREEDQELDVVAADVRFPQMPMWMALLETGARFGELRQLRWSDVDLEKRIVVLRAENTKSRKQRAIPISQELTAELLRLRALQESLGGIQEAVFLAPEGAPWKWNSMRLFQRILGRAGIQKHDAEGRKLDIHALRTTCASRLARRGVPLAIAQRWLGHSDPKLTAQHYTDLGVEDLRAAVERGGAR